MAAEFNTDPLAWSASARPAKTAVIELATGRRLTYAQLDELADRAAAWLAAKMDSASGARLAVLGRNSIDLLAFALGAERAGAVFVPLNWRLTGPELSSLLDDCDPHLILAQSEFLERVPGALPITQAMAELDRLKPTTRHAAGERTITLLYTSGTTGRPRGAIVTATNAFAAALNFIAVGEVAADTVALSDLPMFHTIGLIAVARSTLTAGGTLVLADRFLPRRTLSVLADRALGVTHYFAVPVMLEALAAEAEFDPAALARLHAVFVGGAPLTADLIGRFLAFGVPLVNGYGMSEAGTALHVPIDRDAVRQSAGAVGLPAPHIEVRLVGEAGDAGPGEVGEIWLRGPSVSPGYWRRPQETAAAFAEGWYRTGDLARLEETGFYRIVDRLKDMYISGGENVYPAEVEAVLAAHDDIRDAAILGVPDPRWGETGIAFVVTAAPGGVDAAALMAHCLERLARYKCPARFIGVDAIPRSAAGKILKPALRARFNGGEFE